MLLNRLATGDFSRGLASLSIVHLNVDAVTGSFDGGENRKPRRILNVYVVPPAVGGGTESATSGAMRDPSGAGLSGYITRFAHVEEKKKGVLASAGARGGKLSGTGRAPTPP